MGDKMGLTQLQRLELNKRVDKILHAPSNAPAGGQQLEIAFVTCVSENTEQLYQSVKDAVAALKAHDKIFQNVRSNLVAWSNTEITTKVTPMSFIQMGRAFEDSDKSETKTVDKPLYFEDLCAYLKLYHARCRCILLFMDCTCGELERQHFQVFDIERAKQNLNPFLKYRLLVVTYDKMLTGSEIFLRLVNNGK